MNKEKLQELRDWICDLIDNYWYHESIIGDTINLLIDYWNETQDWSFDWDTYYFVSYDFLEEQAWDIIKNRWLLTFANMIDWVDLRDDRYIDNWDLRNIDDDDIKDWIEEIINKIDEKLEN